MQQATSSMNDDQNNYQVSLRYKFIQVVVADAEVMGA